MPIEQRMIARKARRLGWLDWALQPDPVADPILPADQARTVRLDEILQVPQQGAPADG
jgi:hypothetical protein